MEQPRHYRYELRMTQQEHEYMVRLQLASKAPADGILLRAYHLFLKAQEMHNKGYEIKFINQDGDEFVESTIITP